MKTVLIICSLVLLCACSSFKFSARGSDPLAQISHRNSDTVVMNRVVRDSVYVGHDRLERMIGDTLYVRDSITVYRVVARRDTVRRVEKVEEVKEVPVEVIREVARKRNWFDWMCYGVTGLVVLVLMACIAKRLSLL